MKWEYMFIDVPPDKKVFSINGEQTKDRIHVKDFLQKAGQDGWELAGVGSHDFDQLYFKRPKS